MLCQKCGIREASVHVTKIYNNQKTELHLCEQCAQEHTNRFPFDLDLNFHPFDLDNLITGFFGLNPAGNLSMMNEVYQEKCNFCGSTLDEIRETGRVGCANCYNIFRQAMIPIIKKVHGTIQHTGRFPDANRETVSFEKPAEAMENPLKEKLQKLMNEMKEAINKEEYERAAVIRDEIKEIEKKLKKSGGENK